MDIVKIVKFFHLKASFESLNLKQKFFLVVCLLSLIPMLVPQKTSAMYLVIDNYQPKLIFDTTNRDFEGYLVEISQEATDQYYAEQLVLDKTRQQLLTEKVKEYLQDRNSPMAEYAFVLVTMRNWKQITALANAESTLCRRYPVDKANCWGIGGSNLWDMGDNLAQGIISMNHFLNAYPRRSVIKYSQMSFDDMNGLYKQPAADHWVYNNEQVYNELLAIENSI